MNTCPGHHGYRVDSSLPEPPVRFRWQTEWADIDVRRNSWVCRILGHVWAYPCGLPPIWPITLRDDTVRHLLGDAPIRTTGSYLRLCEQCSIRQKMLIQEPAFDQS